MKKLFLLLTIMVAVVVCVPAQGWGWLSPSGTSQNAYNKDRVVDTLIKAVPVPVITTGQERKMVAWRALTFDVENKMGYVYLLCAGVGPIGYYTIYGKVASLNSFLVRQQDVTSSGAVVEGYDIDGTTGSNIEGVFFRTTDGTYVEIPTTGAMGYIYSDKPLPLKVPALR
jgi:hypothetical protein